MRPKQFIPIVERKASSASGAIEAFPGNALYLDRGMGTMKEYKTVSVVGSDGYKLYDAEAVERLREIALYYRLGLKRNEIRDLMLDPDYEVGQVLEKLLAQKKTEKEKIDQQIRILNYLKRIGIQNGLEDVLKGCMSEALELDPRVGV